MTKKFDSIGRATFHHIPPHAVRSVTEREEQWLCHIMRHGPQSSLYLHELTRRTHKCERTTRAQLQKLRAGGFLTLPSQQRATENANYNRWVYDLAPAGKAYLQERGLWEDCVRPHGHWTHGFMTACITASIDMLAAQNSQNFIPAHKLLERAGVPLACNISRKKLIPDQLFGLDYGGRYRFFCVEADRGTEPTTSKHKRKSLKSSIRDYHTFIRDRLYQDFWGLRANLMLLYVFNSAAKQAAFLQQVEREVGACRFIMAQHVPDFGYFFRPPALFRHLYEGPWQRAGHDDFYINRS